MQNSIGQHPPIIRVEDLLNKPYGSVLIDLILGCNTPEAIEELIRSQVNYRSFLLDALLDRKLLIDLLNHLESIKVDPRAFFIDVLANGEFNLLEHTISTRNIETFRFLLVNNLINPHDVVTYFPGNLVEWILHLCSVDEHYHSFFLKIHNYLDIYIHKYNDASPSIKLPDLYQCKENFSPLAYILSHLNSSPPKCSRFASLLMNQISLDWKTELNQRDERGISTLWIPWLTEHHHSEDFDISMLRVPEDNIDIAYLLEQLVLSLLLQDCQKYPQIEKSRLEKVALEVLNNVLNYPKLLDTLGSTINNYELLKQRPVINQLTLFSLDMRIDPETVALELRETRKLTPLLNIYGVVYYLNKHFNPDQVLLSKVGQKELRQILGFIESIFQFWPKESLKSVVVQQNYGYQHFEKIKQIALDLYSPAESKSNGLRVTSKPIKKTEKERKTEKEAEELIANVAKLRFKKIDSIESVKDIRERIRGALDTSRMISNTVFLRQELTSSLSTLQLVLKYPQGLQKKVLDSYDQQVKYFLELYTGDDLQTYVQAYKLCYRQIKRLLFVDDTVQTSENRKANKSRLNAQLDTPNMEEEEQHDLQAESETIPSEESKYSPAVNSDSLHNASPSSSSSNDTVGFTLVKRKQREAHEEYKPAINRPHGQLRTFFREANSQAVVPSFHKPQANHNYVTILPHNTNRGWGNLSQAYHKPAVVLTENSACAGKDEKHSDEETPVSTQTTSQPAVLEPRQINANAAFQEYIYYYLSQMDRDLTTFCNFMEGLKSKNIMSEAIDSGIKLSQHLKQGIRLQDFFPGTIFSGENVNQLWSQLKLNGVSGTSNVYKYDQSYSKIMKQKLVKSGVPSSSIIFHIWNNFISEHLTTLNCLQAGGYDFVLKNGNGMVNFLSELAETFHHSLLPIRPKTEREQSVHNILIKISTALSGKLPEDEFKSYKLFTYGTQTATWLYKDLGFLECDTDAMIEFRTDPMKHHSIDEAFQKKIEETLGEVAKEFPDLLDPDSISKKYQVGYHEATWTLGFNTHVLFGPGFKIDLTISLERYERTRRKRLLPLAMLYYDVFYGTLYHPNNSLTLFDLFQLVLEPGKTIEHLLTDVPSMGFIMRTLAKLHTVHVLSESIMQLIHLMRLNLHTIETSLPDNTKENALIVLLKKPSLRLAGFLNLVYTHNLVSVFGLDSGRDFEFLMHIKRIFDKKEQEFPGWSLLASDNISPKHLVAMFLNHILLRDHVEEQEQVKTIILEFASRCIERELRGLMESRVQEVQHYVTGKKDDVPVYNHFELRTFYQSRNLLFKPQEAVSLGSDEVKQSQLTT